MVDISIVNWIINQLITGGQHLPIVTIVGKTWWNHGKIGWSLYILWNCDVPNDEQSDEIMKNMGTSKPIGWNSMILWKCVKVWCCLHFDQRILKAGGILAVQKVLFDRRWSAENLGKKPTNQDRSIMNTMVKLLVTKVWVYNLRGETVKHVVLHIRTHVVKFDDSCWQTVLNLNNQSVSLINKKLFRGFNRKPSRFST